MQKIHSELSTAHRARSTVDKRPPKPWVTHNQGPRNPTEPKPGHCWQRCHIPFRSARLRAAAAAARRLRDSRWKRGLTDWNALFSLTLRQHIFARARGEVASPDGRYPVTPAVWDEPSAELRSQGSYYGWQSHHVDEASRYEGPQTLGYTRVSPAVSGLVSSRCFRQKQNSWLTVLETLQRLAFSTEAVPHQSCCLFFSSALPTYRSTRAQGRGGRQRHTHSKCDRECQQHFFFPPLTLWHQVTR